MRSWNVGEHFRAGEFFRALLTTGHKTVKGTIVLKWFQFYFWFCAALEWIRVPLLGLCLWFGLYATAIAFVALALISAAIMLIWDQIIVVGRLERKSHSWKVIILFHVFKMVEQFLRYLGWCNTYFAELPNLKAKPTVVDLEKKFGNETDSSFEPHCPVWLCPWDFEYGRYFRHYNPSDPTRTHSNSLQQRQESNAAVFSTENSSLPRPDRMLNSRIVSTTLCPEETRARAEIIDLLQRGRIPHHVSLAKVEDILRIYPRIAGIRDSAGRYLIHVACQCRASYELIATIAKASPKNPTNADGETALHVACREGSALGVVRFLAEEWPEANRVRDRSGRLPLHLAMGLPLSMVKKFIDQNTHALRTKDRNGNFPLHEACTGFDCADVAIYMVDRDPHAIRQKNQKGDFPLHIACRDPANAALAKKILYKFPRAVKVQNAQCQSPLHIACEHPDYTDIIFKLIEKGPSAIQMRNDGGELPLHVACRSGCTIEVVERLCVGRDNACFLLVDRNGNTPLHLACCSKRLQKEVILRLVVACKSALDKKNSNESLPIHRFCESSSSRLDRSSEIEMDVLGLLRSNSIQSLGSKDSKLRTPLHVACSVEEPRFDIISHLLECYPQAIHERDKYKHTPLHTLCTRKETPPNVIKLLLRVLKRPVDSVGEPDSAGSFSYNPPEDVATPANDRNNSQVAAPTTEDSEVDSNPSVPGSLPFPYQLPIFTLPHKTREAGSITSLASSNCRSCSQSRSSLASSRAVSARTCDFAVSSQTNSNDTTAPIENPGILGSEFSLQTDTVEGIFDDETWLKASNGDTPLHLAIRYSLSRELLSLLEKAFPRSMQMENDQSLTPFQLRIKMLRARRREVIQKKRRRHQSAS